jgi:hypothetical protein
VFKAEWRVLFVCVLNATLTGWDDSIWSHSAIFCNQFRNRWTSLLFQLWACLIRHEPWP